MKKLLKLENIKKRRNLKKYIQIDSELTQIYRPIPCITDLNRPISVELERAAVDITILAIWKSVSYQSPLFRLRLSRYVLVSANMLTMIGTAYYDKTCDAVCLFI